MIPATDRTQNAFEHYLTEGQRSTYQGISNREIQEMIGETLLFSDNPSDIEAAGLILDIMDLFPATKYQGKMSRFFQELFYDGQDNVIAQLKKVQHICRAEKGEQFFECASTKKMDRFYTKKELFHIIDAFTAVLPEIEKLSEDFPCYDQGGKELLANLTCKDTAEREAHPPSPFTPPPPPNFQQLYRLSNSFDLAKSEAIQYLSSLPSNQRLSMDMYSQWFAKIEANSKLGVREQVALMKLALALTSHEKEKLAENLVLEDLNEFHGKIEQLYMHCGERVFHSFCEATMVQNKPSFDLILRILHLLNTFYDDFNCIAYAANALQAYIEKNINVTGLLAKLEENVSVAESFAFLDPDQSDLVHILDRFKGNDPFVSFPLPSKQLKTIHTQYEKVEAYCKEWKQLRLGKLIFIGNEIRKKAQIALLEENELLQLIAIGRLTIHIKYGMYLYPTQILALLGLLSYPDNRCVAQMKTGEGKSAVVALLAFLLVMQNQRVHVISSSPSLAIRDEEEFVRLFQAFDISTGHICRQNRQKIHFQAEILYGTATDFEFALIEELLNNSQLFLEENQPGKRFANAIVDEVDNLTIDTALNGARSGISAEETSTEWVYYPIFQYVKKNQGDFSVDRLKSYLQVYLKGKFTNEIQQISDEQFAVWLVLCQA